ncbi:peptidylprolyl isomerase [Chondromyces apiculatus]|uniref:peptidylprolyl isomerase n=1 Tax=Chondromyces apiculatus DSM 436 TaxID=1192034 RepID=A0A017SWX6_9BACT|nr:peptidylprolyl isomerase [Chondromyces apiculatus]EYF00836.1 Hypothetical protein CAP_8997 [Chondromyces apiculatus DSM 436]
MNRLSQLITGLVVFAIAVVFVSSFGPSTGASPAKGAEITCAVEVQGDCVKSTDFWAAYRLIAPRNADAERIKQLGLRQLTAEGLYERWLLLEDAKRLGLAISDDDLNTEILAGRAHVTVPVDAVGNDRRNQLTNMLGLPGDGEHFRVLDVNDRKTKKFDKKRYERDVRLLTKMSPSDFREFQRKELLAGRVRDLVRARVRISEDEAYQQFARDKGTRTIDYVRFDRRFFADLVVDMSDKAVLAWSDRHKEELDKGWDARKAQYQPECRVARHVLARVKEDADDADKAKAKAKIARAEALLKQGVNFSDVARRLSDDTSAARGGELGCMGKGKTVKPFEDKLFSLKAGEVSGPVETEYGYHLILVDQIAAGDDNEKIARGQLAREMYLMQEADRLAADAAKQVLAATGGGKSLKDALDTYLAGLTAAQDEANKAAGKDKKKAATTTKPKATKPEKAAAKSEGEGADKGSADADKSEGADKPEAAAGAVEENEILTFATHPHRPTIETSLPFNQSGSPLPSAQDGTGVARNVFELAKAGDTLKDVVQLANGYAAVQLKEVTAVTDEQWQKDRETYMGSLRGAKQDDAVLNYVRRLKSTLGSEVKYDKALVTEPKAGESDGAPMSDEGE